MRRLLCAASVLFAVATAPALALDAAAIGAAESALRAQPDSVERMLELARRLALATPASVRQPARAVSLAREALLKAPDDARCWEVLAVAHYAAGAYDRALRAADEMAARRQARGLDLTLAQEELRTRCRKAAETFALLEISP
jgi:predicted Zn-dependent protease